MKKIYQFILILIALVSLCGPMATVEARDNLGRAQTFDECMEDWQPKIAQGSITKAGAEQDCSIRFSKKSGNQIIPGKAGDPNPDAATVKICDPKNIIDGKCTTPYVLLAPINTSDGSGLTEINPAEHNALGKYLNMMLKIFIGLCSVLAVVMIVMGGIEYMTSELGSSKEHGKETILNAVIGLIMALGSYALLNTLNPDLLNTDIVIKNTVIQYENFPISGALSRNGVATTVNFNTEAYPAAKAASAQTGVDEAFILAIFAQETSSGSNVGACTPANANMYPEDRAALEKIVGSANVNTTNVSCASGGGHGGAIGLAQFRPSTWIENRDNASRDPWNTNDALMVAGIYLNKLGGSGDARNAACKYYSGVACTPGRVPPNEFYGDQVVAKMTSLKEQIAQKKQDGTIK